MKCVLIIGIWSHLEKRFTWIDLLYLLRDKQRNNN